MLCCCHRCVFVNGVCCSERCVVLIAVIILVHCHCSDLVAALLLLLFHTLTCGVSDVAFFGEHLDKYHKQHSMAVKIKEKRPIGMLLVDATKMKGLLIPSPLRCLDVSGSLDR